MFNKPFAAIMLMSMSSTFYVMTMTGNGLRDYIPVGREKLGEITCKHTPIKMVGWVDKKEFVDGSPIQIYIVSGEHESLILEGVIEKTEKETYVNGTYYGQYVPEAISWDNYDMPHEDNDKPRKGLGSLLSIGVTSMVRNNSQAHFRDDDGSHQVKGVFKVWNSEEGKFKATEKSRKINDHRYEPFCISLEKPMECYSDFSPLIGCEKHRIIQHQRKQNSGNWIIELDPKLWEETYSCLGECKKIQSIYRISDDVKYSISGDWTVVFANGDRWIGELYGRGEFNNNSYLSGTLYLANGDIIQSGCDGIGSKYVFCNDGTLKDLHSFDPYGPISILVRFADGEEFGLGAYDDYGLEKEVQRAIYDGSETPRDYLSNLEKASEDEEKERLQRIKVREEKTIRKYGETFGKAINEHRLLKGMSQDMVNELYPRDLYHRSIVGNKIVWRYDRSKQNSVLGALFVATVLEAGGRIPVQLDFVNDKLVSILY